MIVDQSVSPKRKSRSQSPKSRSRSRRSPKSRSRSRSPKSRSKSPIPKIMIAKRQSTFPVRKSISPMKTTSLISNKTVIPKKSPKQILLPSPQKRKERLFKN